MLEFEGESEEEGDDATQAMDVEKFRPVQGPVHRGAPWFQEMVEKTPLGKIKRQKGGHTTTGSDGTVEQVEWEVFEWNGEDDDSPDASAPKRKIGEVEEADAEMRT
jgi:hypothetical protein